MADPEGNCNADREPCAMGSAIDEHVYVRDLEEHLRKVLFEETSTTNSQAAVLLVRGALAGGDRVRAAQLAQATQGLAEAKPGDRDIAAAATHARGLVERDSAMLDRAACAYSAPMSRAKATEDAGQVSSVRGDHGDAVARLRRAYEQYERQGRADDMARVRSQLRVAGVRLHHWTYGDRPAVGWASLTDTERRVAELVSRGLSNRQVAGKLFLSAHTVAFHLRHIFCKLEIGSRVQLARMVAEEAAVDS
jgi:DNA-binding CsgD family transcriptional regulator